MIRSKAGEIGADSASNLDQVVKFVPSCHKTVATASDPSNFSSDTHASAWVSAPQLPNEFSTTSLVNASSYPGTNGTCSESE